MAIASPTRTDRVLVVLNPGSGGCSADEVRAALGRHFACDDGSCRVHELKPGGEDVVEVVRRAVAEGIDLVVAAGGDGTVSAVAGGLIGSEVPLGIVPLGTANVLARELGLPMDLEGACTLLAEGGEVRAIDALQVGDRVFFTQLGVGIDALMIRDTDDTAKKRFGRIAYLWTAMTRLIGFQPRRFLLEIDGKSIQRSATQVVVANVGTLGQKPFQWGPDIRVDDGKVTVCVVRARTGLDYVGVIWQVLNGHRNRHPNVRYYEARERVAVRTRKKPLPVQADGEVIGNTPVEVSVVASAVRVVVPIA